MTPLLYHGQLLQLGLATGPETRLEVLKQIVRGMVTNFLHTYIL